MGIARISLLLALAVSTLAWSAPPFEHKASQSFYPFPQSPEDQFQSELRSCNMKLNYFTSLHHKQSGFTDLEWLALNFYMGTGYECVNSRLRKGDSASIKQFVNALDSALNKLPVSSDTLYRGSRSYPNLPKLHQVVRYPAYLSTSYMPEVAEEFGSVQYEIHAKHCRDASRINGFESEVICPRNMTFKVRSIKSDGNVVHYVLDEVLAASTKEGK